MRFGHIPENCTQSWQLRYTLKYPLFYIVCQNVKILKILPLSEINTFYFHQNNENHILAIYCWYKPHTF